MLRHRELKNFHTPNNNSKRNIVDPSSLQEVNYRDGKVSHGIKLWLVGVNSAKDLLLSQLAIDNPAPATSTSARSY